MKTKPQKPRSIEAKFMVDGKIGESFYTEKPDRTITALAHHYNRKINTERGVAILLNNRLNGFNITKVTILK